MSTAATRAPHATTDTRPEHRWWTLAAVCLGIFMLLIDISIVNVALPSIQHDLSSSFSDLQWVVDAYALTLAAALLTAGSLADLFGRRLLYMIGLAAFTVASLLCGIATTTLWLQLARGVQGIGGAIMFAVSLALLADAFRGRDRGIAFSVWGAVAGLSVAIGPLVGGALTSGASWRWIFFVNLPIGVGALAITATRVRESRDPRPHRPDWPGFVSFTASLAFLVFGLIKASDRGFTDALVLGCFAAAVVLMVAFLVTEFRVQNPMFDLSLFRKPAFVGGDVAAFGVSATIFSMLLYLTLYLQDLLGYSAFGTGLRLLTASGAILVTAAIAGRLSAHVPVRLLIGPGLLLVGVGLLLMRGLTAASTWTHLIPGLVVSGVGVGLINPPLASTAVGVVPPRQSGMASGINSTFRQVGIATGIALLGSLFADRVRQTIGANLARIPHLGHHAGQVGAALTNGQLGKLLPRLPAAQRAQVAGAARASFTTGLDRILLIAAVIAFVAGVVALSLIRSRDFVSSEHAAA